MNMPSASTTSIWFSNGCGTSLNSDSKSIDCAGNSADSNAMTGPSSNSTSSTLICMGMSDVAVAMILVLLIITTIVGNILVVLSIAVYRRMRTFTNVLLVSLASADLLVGILVMPIALVDQLHRHRWQF